MKDKHDNAHRNEILVYFRDDDTVVWYSVGWGDNAELMAAARKAINDGNTPIEVTGLLHDAGFDVTTI